jgi:F0F1-type ATP synthase assembly protein I
VAAVTRVAPTIAKPLAWMAGSSIGSWLAVSAAGGAELNPEILLGMAGPLTSASVTWILLARTHAAAPERVTNALMIGFAAKMVLFAAYVVVMIGVLRVRPVPFVAGFAAYFIVLHMMEAVFLRRLLAPAMRPSAS